MVKTFQISQKIFEPSEKEEVKQFANNHSVMFPNLFNNKNPLFISRAPGRLDIMGGIADYSGSVVCEGTLKCRTLVGVQQNNSSHIHIMTKLSDNMGLKTAGNISLNKLFIKENTKLLPLEKVRGNFHKLNKLSWTAYALGGLYFLLESGLITPQKNGINMGIISDIPLGCGVSSSASLEVSAFIAIIGALGLNDKFSPMEIAKLCQRVENEIVGAPCGIMDQVTCILGEKRTLIKLECQPHNFLGKISIPESVRFIGINSNVKHSVGGDQYKKRTNRCIYGA
jgi:L-arabinokinase